MAELDYFQTYSGRIPDQCKSFVFGVQDGSWTARAAPKHEVPTRPGPTAPAPQAALDRETALQRFTAYLERTLKQVKQAEDAAFFRKYTISVPTPRQKAEQTWQRLRAAPRAPVPVSRTGHAWLSGGGTVGSIGGLLGIADATQHPRHAALADAVLAGKLGR